MFARPLYASLTLLSALCLSQLALAGEPLVASDAVPGSLSANTSVTSEYFFRGLSQTGGLPAIQGGLDYALSLAAPVELYAGVWSSNVRFSQATLEADLYAGLRGAVGAFSWDLGAYAYLYPGAAASLAYDFFEGALGLGYDLGFASFSLSANYSPNNFGASGQALYTRLGLEAPLGDRLTLSAGVGYQTIEDNAAFGTPDYLDYSVGLGATLVGVDAALSFQGAAIEGCASGCQGLVFSLSKSL